MARPRKTCKSRKKVSRKRKQSSRTNNRRSDRGRLVRCQSSEFTIPLNVPKNLHGIKFDTYIKRVLKKVKPRLEIRRESLQLMDNLMKDTLHQIAQHASTKMGRRKTLKPQIIKKGLTKIMPKRLLEKVDAHAQDVLDRYVRQRKSNKAGRKRQK